MNEFEKQLANQPLKSVPASWRAQILKEAQARAAGHERTFTAQVRARLRERLWPSPLAWGAVAAGWIVIFALQWVTPGSSPTNSRQVAQRPATSVPEQQRELARLLEATAGHLDRAPADRPRSARNIPQTSV